MFFDGLDFFYISLFFKEVIMKNKKEFIRVILFALFSASAGIIQTVSFAILNEFFHFNYWVCYLTALILSVLWNFTLGFI